MKHQDPSIELMQCQRGRYDSDEPSRWETPPAPGLGERLLYAFGAIAVFVVVCVGMAMLAALAPGFVTFTGAALSLIGNVLLVCIGGPILWLVKHWLLLALMAVFLWALADFQNNKT